MQEITLVLSAQEVGAILQTLGQLPTSSGAYPLVVKIDEQVKAQTKPSDAAPLIIRIPPINVNACLMIPNTCSLFIVRLFFVK